MKNPHRSPATIAVSQWGREERSLEDKQETDFFIEALRKRNTGQRGWHQADDVVGLMRGYLRAVEDAYRAEPGHLARVWCQDCGIPLLTSRSNEGRTDLRCPTGCRDRHDQEASRRRSGEYYKTEAGREKKRALNQHRKSKATAVPAIQEPAVPAIIRYYCWLIRALDGLKLDTAAIVELRSHLAREVRQRSQDFRDEVRENRDD